jgi:hypothetical protein
MTSNGHSTEIKSGLRLKQFPLEQMRVPDWPHYPMNDRLKLTPLQRKCLRRCARQGRFRQIRGIDLYVTQRAARDRPNI